MNLAGMLERTSRRRTDGRRGEGNLLPRGTDRRLPIVGNMLEGLRQNLFRRRADVVRLWRVCRQAPWRTQTQAVAAWAVILLVAAVVGGLYLAAASRAGTAGRDLQFLEARRAELRQANDELRAKLATARSIRRLANRARELGFVPAQADEIEYLPVPNYPQSPQQQFADIAEPPVAASSAPAGWLLNALHTLIAGGG